MALATKRAQKARPIWKRPVIRRLLRWTLIAISAFYTFIVVVLILLRWMNPPFTAVQIERRVQSWTEHSPYQKRYAFVSLVGISPHLQHAVIAAEDARFFQHHGFDWKEIGSAIEQDVENGRARGASTITQQLVRNLFLTTHRSILRKGIELSIVPLTEAILSKRRILRLYLNVIEWGRGSTVRNQLHAITTISPPSISRESRLYSLQQYCRPPCTEGSGTLRRTPAASSKECGRWTGEDRTGSSLSKYGSYPANIRHSSRSAGMRTSPGVCFLVRLRQSVTALRTLRCPSGSFSVWAIYFRAVSTNTLN